MSEEHRNEVDTRIDEIMNRPHRVNVNHYEEIRDMVTRFVQLHHEFLQEAGNTLVQADMPLDAIKQVLSFLESGYEMMRQ